MKLEDYIKKIAVILDAPDVQEATLDVGITILNGCVLVKEDSLNRIKFAVSRKQK